MTFSRSREAMRMVGRKAGNGGAVALGVAQWLRLGAAPTFAGMALLSGMSGGDQMDIFCGAGQGGPALGGMTTMYLLMSAFHLTPWLGVITGRHRNDSHV